MRFEWDENKNRSNRAKHGLDFADAERVFSSPWPFLVRLDHRQEYGEDRWQGIGMLYDTVVVVIIFTEPGTDVIRVISMRKATTNEQRQYEKRIKERLGPGDGHAG